jgi:hypothetical protein
MCTGGSILYHACAQEEAFCIMLVRRRKHSVSCLCTGGSILYHACAQEEAFCIMLVRRRKHSVSCLCTGGSILYHACARREHSVSCLCTGGSILYHACAQEEAFCIMLVRRRKHSVSCSRQRRNFLQICSSNSQTSGKDRPQLNPTCAWCKQVCTTGCVSKEHGSGRASFAFESGIDACRLVHGTYIESL